MLTFYPIFDIQDERSGPVNAIFNFLFVKQTRKYKHENNIRSTDTDFKIVVYFLTTAFSQIEGLLSLIHTFSNIICIEELHMSYPNDKLDLRVSFYVVEKKLFFWFNR